MTLQALNQELLTCRRCLRLVEWRERTALEKRKAYRAEPYWGLPVPGFGDPQARVMAVGLAPGAHGSNRTGRMFTGDASGDFLYPALYRAGFASQPNAREREDGLTLKNLYITAAARCAPPENKPSPQELRNCQPFLAAEISLLRPRVVVALGRIAFESLLRIFFDAKTLPAGLKFAHAAAYRLQIQKFGRLTLLCSYHPSRQNTQTGRLTPAMFDAIWQKATMLLENDDETNP